MHFLTRSLQTGTHALATQNHIFYNTLSRISLSCYSSTFLLHKIVYSITCFLGSLLLSIHTLSTQYCIFHNTLRSIHVNSLTSYNYVKIIPKSQPFHSMHTAEFCIEIILSLIITNLFTYSSRHYTTYHDIQEQNL